MFQVEEVGAANKEHAQLTANKPTVQPLFKVKYHIHYLTLNTLISAPMSMFIYKTPDALDLQLNSDLLQEAETKNRLLRSVAGSGVEQISELQTKWDKLELLMESHELMIKEQVTGYLML